jgi:AcrR family transcriptional regulator
VARKKKMSAPQRRAQLITVGRAVFAEKGFEATSVEEIASRAGVSKPIVYQHFGGKQGLYAVVVDREMTHVVSVITQAIATGEPRERVEQAALAFLHYVEGHPDGFSVLSHDAPVASGRGCMSSLINDLAERVEELVAAMFTDAGYDPSLAPIYANALVGMVSFVGQWWTDNRDLPVETVASHLSALAWVGLRNLPAKPQVLPPSSGDQAN